KNFHLKNKGDYANAKFVAEKKLPGLSALRFGSEYNYSRDQTNFVDYNDVKNHLNIKESIVATFVESDIYITNKLAAKLGARTEHSSLLDKWNIAPRISIAYQFKNRGQASLAYGDFYQNPDNKYLPALQALHFQKATHYIA